MKLITAMLVLLGSMPLIGQAPQKIVYWSGDPGCGYKSQSVENSKSLVCSVVETSRGKVSSLSYNGLVLSVAFLEDGKYLIIGAKISNFSNGPITFDSDLWGAAHFKSRASFFAAEKPILAETSLPTRELVKEMSGSARIGDTADQTMAEGQVVGEIHNVRNPDGTTSRKVVIVPDQAALDIAQQSSDTRAASVKGEQERLRSTALTAKSVPPGGAVKGLVYFKRVKKAGFVLFSVPVDGTNFMFMLPRKAG